jgi:hypothetical protein
MMEQLWTFIQTLCKGTVQGVNQYIDNDLRDYIPLLIFAALVVLFTLIKRIIRKNKSK